MTNRVKHCPCGKKLKIVGNRKYCDDECLKEYGSRQKDKRREQIPIAEPDSKVRQESCTPEQKMILAARLEHLFDCERRRIRPVPVREWRLAVQENWK